MSSIWGLASVDSVRLVTRVGLLMNGDPTLKSCRTGVVVYSPCRRNGGQVGIYCTVRHRVFCDWTMDCVGKILAVHDRVSAVLGNKVREKDREVTER
jgi:hypothetical protein